MKTKKSPLSQLQKDLKRFTKDWKNLLKHSELAQNSTFLKQLSQDIKNLNDDSLTPSLPDNLENLAHLIHHLLSTPIGAPIAPDKTLLEAALTLQYQDPIRSDLSDITLEFIKHSPDAHNEFLTLLDSFNYIIKKKPRS